MAYELILLGGFDEESRAEDRGAAETWRMSLATGQWRRTSDMSRPRSFFGSAAVGDKIIAIGEGIDRYHPALDRWQSLVKDGFPRSHFAAVADGPRVYVLGGFPTCAGGCIGYDTETGRVFDPPEPPGFEPCDHFHIMANLAGEVHIVGGLANDTFTPMTDHWVLREGTWHAAPPAPFPVWAKFAIVQCTGNELFIFEGSRGARFDSRTGCWSAVSGPGSVLVMPASFELDGKIHILGGMRVEGGPTREVWSYSIDRDRWSFPQP